MNQRQKDAINNYTNGKIPPSNLLATLGMEIATMNLNEMLGGNFGRNNIAKLLTTLPIRTIELDLGNCWDEQYEILQGLLPAKWTDSLIIKACNEEISFLPSNIRQIDIQVEGDVNALRWAITLENILQVRQEGGTVSDHFWANVAARSTKLEYIELSNVDIWANTTTSMSEAMARVERINLINMKLNGKPLGETEIMKIINRKMESYTNEP